MITGIGLMLLGLFIGIQNLRDARPVTATGKSSEANMLWELYSEERILELRKLGRPVFVDFSASWCLTCQVNERAVLKTADVQKAFSDKNVALLRAAWTRAVADLETGRTARDLDD
jgi:thiol:disulfide interchange protein DsbD